MTRPIVVLRPEPGNTTTIARLVGAGRSVIRLPLFELRALDWAVPDPAGFDALMLTSANAVRYAGSGLAALTGLPALTVGGATADAARAAGLTVTLVGTADVGALIAAAEAAGVRRALLLAGRDRMLDAGGAVAQAIAVYASDPLPITPADLAALDGATVQLHSTRAASRFAELIEAATIDRAGIRLAAISRAVADAAGRGWGHVAVADAPTDAALGRAAALAD